MICKVIQRNIRISHRKAQLVCDLVRDKKIKDALIILDNTHKKFAPIVKKLLSSAIANATNNHGMNAEKLYIYTIVANQGPTWKRTMPRARGSADLVRKRTTHLVIELSDNPNERKEQLLAMKNKKQRNKENNSVAKNVAKEKAKTTSTPKNVAKPKDEAQTKVATDNAKKTTTTKKTKESSIDVNQKHTVVSMAEFSDYNYDRRRKEWHEKAGHNEKQVVCSICKDDDNWESIKLENGDHICYYCWIKKPETLKKMKEGK